MLSRFFEVGHVEWSSEGFHVSVTSFIWVEDSCSLSTKFYQDLPDYNMAWHFTQYEDWTIYEQYASPMVRLMLHTLGETETLICGVMCHNDHKVWQPSSTTDTPINQAMLFSCSSTNLQTSVLSAQASGSTFALTASGSNHSISCLCLWGSTPPPCAFPGVASNWNFLWWIPPTFFLLSSTPKLSTWISSFQWRNLDFRCWTLNSYLWSWRSVHLQG